MTTAKRKVGVRPAPAPQIGRQDIWTAIRKFDGAFTLEQLLDASRASRTTAQRYLRCLTAGGCMSVSEDGSYTLLKDSGFHAPRLKADGQPVTYGAGMENMWRSMRMLSQFSWRDIAVHSTTDTVQVSAATAKTFCTMLLRCGYLRVVQKADPRGKIAIYRLIRNTGPLPPKVQRVRQIFDPNTREIYTLEDRA